jgi:hypothetical protein
MLSERESRYRKQKEQGHGKCITHRAVVETHPGRAGQCTGSRNRTDTAIHKRFNERCARFLHAVLQEMASVVVTAPHEVPLKLLRRFSAVVLEDSSSIALPDELAESWQGCGGQPEDACAALKLHVRWDLRRGQLRGQSLTSGRTSDRSSPFKEEPLPVGSLSIADLG